MVPWTSTLSEKDSVPLSNLKVVDWLPAAMPTNPINSRILTSSVLLFHN